MNNIPTHDPQTGELNPYYEELTGEKNPLSPEKKYPIGGFAPGNYMCKCVTCKHEFQGDKRSVQCETCAIEMVKTKIEVAENGGIEIVHDYLPGFIDQFGDGPLGELNPNDWDALQFLKWLKLNNYKIIKNGRKIPN